MFSKWGDLIGIVSRRSMPFGEDDFRNRFIVTMIFLPSNHEFMMEAINRFDEYIEYTKERQWKLDQIAPTLIY